MNYLKCFTAMFVCILCFGQDSFKDIKVPHYGPYFKRWEDKAKQGDPLAMLDLFEWSEGVYNANTDIPLPPVGVCVEWQPNAEKLIHQKVKELADHGNVEAMKAMGYFAVENKTSKMYLEKAAALNDPYAILDLGGDLDYGDPKLDKMFDKAAKLFIERAKNNDRKAMYAIVCELPFSVLDKQVVNDTFNNLVKTKDFFAGAAYYSRARIVFSRGDWNLKNPHDRSLAMQWLEDAAQCGEVRAMLELGQIYYHGGNDMYSLKVPKNIERAWYWARAYRKAVGCPSPDVDPPIDGDTGKPWKRPNMAHSQKHPQ